MKYYIVVVVLHEHDIRLDFSYINTSWKNLYEAKNMMIHQFFCHGRRVTITIQSEWPKVHQTWGRLRTGFYVEKQVTYSLFHEMFEDMMTQDKL